MTKFCMLIPKSPQNLWWWRMLCPPFSYPFPYVIFKVEFIMPQFPFFSFFLLFFISFFPFFFASLEWLWGALKQYMSKCKSCTALWTVSLLTHLPQLIKTFWSTYCSILNLLAVKQCFFAQKLLNYSTWWVADKRFFFLKWKFFSCYCYLVSRSIYQVTKFLVSSTFFFFLNWGIAFLFRHPHTFSVWSQWKLLVAHKPRLSLLVPPGKQKEEHWSSVCILQEWNWGQERFQGILWVQHF